MKNKKLILFVITQIFIFSTVILTNTSTSNFLPVWNNKNQDSMISTNDAVIMWANNGEVISNASNDQLYPEICSDGQGGAIITWKDERNSADGDIYAQRVNSSGHAQWTADGVPICPPAPIRCFKRP